MSAGRRLRGTALLIAGVAVLMSPAWAQDALAEPVTASASAASAAAAAMPASTSGVGVAAFSPAAPSSAPVFPVRPTEAERLAANPLPLVGGQGDAQVERGRYLTTLGDCVACHSVAGGQPMAGGYAFNTPFGTIYASNITPSVKSGIGGYTLAQFSRALRAGVRADGQPLYPAMPYTAYAQVSDEDTAALYAYFMKGVAPVDAPAPASELAFPFNLRLLMAAWNLLFLDAKPYVPDAAESAEWNRGAYLARGLAHCTTCHTPRNLLMAEDPRRYLGGAELWPWFAPNISSDANSGIGQWSEADLVAYLRDGDAPGKGQAAGPMAEAVDHSFRYLRDADLKAIAVYLKSVPALHDAADQRPADAWGAPSNALASLRGAALPADQGQMSGPQLYDAWCASCHQASATGTPGGGLPSLIHNTALGRAQPNNLVMVILTGLARPHGEGMPAFGHELSDAQVATLSNYLTRQWGNPAAQVTPQQVAQARAGVRPSSGVSLLTLARVGLAVGALLLLALLVWLLRRGRRRRSTGFDA